MRNTDEEARNHRGDSAATAMHPPNSAPNQAVRRRVFRGQTPRPLREQAEALLIKSAKARWSSLESQPPQLLHELEVHQTELEIQNEALRSAEGELAASLDRYSLLYDFAPVGYVTLDAQGVIVQANLTAAKLLGLDRQVLLHKKLSLFLAPESRRAFAAHRQNVRNSDAKQTCDLRLRRPGGATFEARLESIAMTEAQTCQRQCWTALSDVTERKRAEDALRQAEARLNYLLRANPAVIYSSKAADGYPTTFISENASSVFGYEAAEFLACPRFWVDHIHPQDRPTVLAALAKLRNQEHHSIEYRFQHKDGSYRWVRDDARLLKDSSGRPAEIVGSCIDVNGRKWMEDALRQSEQSLASFFAEAPLGLLWVTPDGRILRANRALATLLGQRAEELFGQRVADFGADPDIVPAMIEQLARRQSLQDNLVRLRHKDGTILHALIAANGMWENGRMVHSRWFIRDVTRRVELQKEILGIGEGVQRRIGQDLHDDLCQQLTGIEFLSQALERRLANRSPVEASRAREIARLTRQAIGYTRELSHTMSPMELAADGLADALRNLADRTKRVFKVDCRFRGDSTPIADDGVTRIYLYRIAQEAINNAIKHGKAKRIQIGLETTGESIVLRVDDNGTGLPQKLPPKHGFGLRIMDYRAATLGGSLTVQRRKRGGTCVLCSIPKGLRQPAGSSVL
jgi:PAS domain S-box-containing protein